MCHNQFQIMETNEVGNPFNDSIAYLNVTNENEFFKELYSSYLWQWKALCLLYTHIYTSIMSQFVTDFHLGLHIPRSRSLDHIKAFNNVVDVEMKWMPHLL